MREDNMQQPNDMVVPSQEQQVQFIITVKNKFKRGDERSVRIRPSNFEGDGYYANDWKEKPDPHEYDLSTMDYLVIEPDDKIGKRDVYIELPYVADFEFYQGSGEEKQPVCIKEIKRDTNPLKSENQKDIEDARTVIVISPDQIAWKLKIWVPKDKNELYCPQNLLTKYLEMSNGTRDSVSVGSNGP